MLELYNAPISTCSQKVRIALTEKGLEWVDRRMYFATNDHLKPDYLKLNPNGVVPTLVHDGRPVIDSSVINEYLEDVFPERPLRPADPYELARMRAWRQYIDEVPTPAIRVPSFQKKFLRAWQNLSDAQFQKVADARPLRKHFYESMGTQGFAEKTYNDAIEKLGQTLQRMEASLANGPWLIGEMFTLADVSLIPTLVRMEDLELDTMWKDLPRVTSWFRRIQDRPSFAVAYYAEARQLGGPC